MDSVNPFIRLRVFGRLKQIIQSYKNNPLEITDRRLLRGLYRRKLRDFDEDQELRNEKLTLIQRLKRNFQLEDDGDSPSMLEEDPLIIRKRYMMANS